MSCIVSHQRKVERVLMIYRFLKEIVVNNGPNILGTETSDNVDKFELKIVIIGNVYRASRDKGKERY